MISSFFPWGFWCPMSWLLWQIYFFFLVWYNDILTSVIHWLIINTTTFNVPPRSARGVAASGVSLILKIAWGHQIWRVMLLSALGSMLLKLLQMAPKCMLMMGRFLQPLLMLASRQSLFPIVLLPVRKYSKYSITLFLVSISYHMFNRAHIARWCAENHCPLKIVKDREFAVLMKAAARPSTNIPSPMTVSWDIKLAFDSSHEHIDRILKVRRVLIII